MKIRGSESLPEVRDAGPVAVRRDPNDPVSSAMAAAAGYDARAGESIARGMQDLAAGIDKMARDRAEAGALAAYNDYVDRSSHLLYDPDTGLMHAKGAGAEGLSDRAYQAHKKLKDEISRTLPAAQRKLFADRTASYDRSVGMSCMKLEGEQMSLYKREEAERTLSTICTAAALDPDGFSMEAQEDAIKEITIAMFGDQGPEANLKNSGRVRSTFFMGMIQQVAQNDPMHAEKLLQEYGRYMEPDEAQKLKLSIDKASMPVKAQAEAQRLFERYGIDGLAQALAEIRDTYEGKEEDLYISYANSLFSDAQQARNAARDKVCDAAADMLNHKAGYSKISAYLAQNEALLGPRLFRRLKDDAEREYGVGRYAPRAVYGGGGTGSGRTSLAPAAKMALFYKAKEELMSGKYASAAEFAEAYANAGFSYTDLQRLAYPVFGKNGAGSGGKDKFNKFNALSVVTKMTKDYGLDESPEEEMAFWGAFSAACQDKEKEKKAPLSNEEMVGIARDMFTQRVITSEYSTIGRGLKSFFGYEIGPGRETTAYGYQIKTAEMEGRVFTGDSTGVPYTVDEEGNYRGWKPEHDPKLKSLEKRSIKAEDFYPDKPVKKEPLFPYAGIQTEKQKTEKKEDKYKKDAEKKKKDKNVSNSRRVPDIPGSSD